MMMSSRSSYTAAMLKAALLVFFVITAVIMVRFTPVKELFTADKLGSYLEYTGYWGPLLFMLIFAVGACLFVPYTAMATLGAVLFGVYWGFLYVWIGALAGASASFLIGRTLGRDFAAHLIGDRLGKYNDAIARNGFTAVVYVRLIYLPFAPVNYGLGLTKVGFWDYVSGSGLAFMVETWIVIFAADAIKRSLAMGSWEPMLSGKVFFAVGLFIMSLFIPKGLKLLLERQRRRVSALASLEIPNSPPNRANMETPSNA
jgi:uncharacterized membrane protein YdjX (TVP38/TMEM64 family)